MMHHTENAPVPARWIVARFGAYMHYAVPRILHSADMLECLYTDLYAGDAGTWLLNYLPSSLRTRAMKRLLGRYTPEIPRERIKTFPALGFEYYWRQFLANDTESRSAAYL